MTEGRTDGRAEMEGQEGEGGEGHQGETDRLAQASLRPHPRSYFRTNLWECPREQGRTDEEEGKKLRWVVGNGSGGMGDGRLSANCPANMRAHSLGLSPVRAQPTSPNAKVLRVPLICPVAPKNNAADIQKEIFVLY